MKQIRATLAAALLSFLAPVTAADAGLFGSCESRPGTPTNLNATFTGNGVHLSFTNTARDGRIWWDVEARDAAGNPVNVGGPGSWETPGKRNQPLGINLYMPPLQGGTTYCFRVRARDRAGTEGCVSEIWTGPVCVAIPASEQISFCNRYADDAINQSGKLQSMRMGGSCAASGPRWLAPWQEHHNWCMAMRGNPSWAQAPDVERNARNESLSQCETSYELIYRYSGSSEATPRTSASPPPPPPPPPPPTVCAVNTLLTVDQCYNLDGTPSQYYTPGSTQALGCGTSEDEAVTAAKISLGIALEDDPAPGACTFSTQTFGGVCTCSPMRNARTFTKPPFRVPQQACAGELKPNAAGRCACPSGTNQSGFRCVASGSGGVNMIQSQTPGATPAADKACAGNMTMGPGGRCSCPAGMVWNVSQCVPASGGSGGINMVQPDGSRTVPAPGINAGRPGVPVLPCPSGTTGVYPNCRPVVGGGGSNMIQPGRSKPVPPPATSVNAGRPGTPVGGGGSNMVQPGSSLPPHTQAPVQQVCPEGTRPLKRRGRVIRCVMSERPPGATHRPDQLQFPRLCPPGTVGSWPHCRRQVTTQPPKVCPEGTFGVWPRCRRKLDPKPTTVCPHGTVGVYPRCRKIASPTPAGPKPTPTGPSPKPIPTGPSPKPQGPIVR